MKIYKITEASDYLGVSINTLKTLANKGERMQDKQSGINYHPITFQHYLIEPIITGAKTQTRRVLNPQPNPDFLKRGLFSVVPQWPQQNGVRWFMNDGCSELLKCPYGKPGDRLWVSEKHALVGLPGDCMAVFPNGAVKWQSGDMVPKSALFNPAKLKNLKWRSSRFMPRWAHRLELEIVEIRAQRLQEISEQDARAEGIPLEPCTHPECVATRKQTGKDPCANGSYRAAFALGWDKINGKRGYAWAQNPWVWSVTFKLIL